MSGTAHGGYTTYLSVVGRSAIPDDLRLSSGVVRGTVDRGVRAFFGIPYAAPPTEPDRLAAPRPAAPWGGVRDGTTRGPNAPQRTRAVPGLDVVPLVGTGWVSGDDYPTLDMWAPEGAAARLPVMVFIHGGGFVIGSKDAPVQDGSRFARDGMSAWRSTIGSGSTASCRSPACRPTSACAT